MLEVRHVSKSFGKVRAVDDLSFTAGPGAVFGLLGPNGAGKTTSIRMILDILAPDHGEVMWGGRRVDAGIRSMFGYLPEERGLYPKMRLDLQLLFFARLHGMPQSEAKTRIAQLANAFHLEEALKKNPVELSKGNQQKVQFMAAIAHRPPLLVHDEPFAGLDPINVEIFKRQIRDLLAQGTVIVLSSHRMEQVEELCKSFCIIDRSRVVVKGELAEIKRTWPDRFIRLTAPRDASFLNRFPGVDPLPGEDGLLKLRLRPEIAPSDILRAAVDSGPVDHFEVVEPTLNDIYLHYVRPEEPAA
ncbi:MAG: ATP-binding cassette domain-containing protein [Candidatus Eremiobacteraeota bacterium]|nr:ATP-binding cassette domain-containing protein [Candidatus Eremiobacteraeota bacterium]